MSESEEEATFLRRVTDLSRAYNIATQDFFEREGLTDSLPMRSFLMAHLTSISMVMAGLDEASRQKEVLWFAQFAAQRLDEMSKATAADYRNWQEKKRRGI